MPAILVRSGAPARCPPSRTWRRRRRRTTALGHPSDPSRSPRSPAPVASEARRAISRVVSMVAEASSDSASPTPARRSSRAGRRRRSGTAPGDGWPGPTPPPSPGRLPPGGGLHLRARSACDLGTSSVSSASICMVCGARCSSATAYRLEARIRASRSAIIPSSRSARRYHGVLPRVSETCRKASRPWSGLGAVGEPAEHRRQQLPLDLGLPGDALAEGGDVPEGGLGVGVAERLEPVLRRGLGQPQLLRGDPGHRVQQRGVEQPLVQPADLLAGVLPDRPHLLGRLA